MTGRSSDRPRTRRLDRRARRLALAAATVLLVGAATACEPTAPTLTLVVTTSADGIDAVPGDGVCETTAGSGVCTLRAAITEANATEGRDVITIASGVDPVLDRAGAAEDGNATGDLDVIGDVTIEGAGATVDARGLDRVFDVRSGRLELRDLTVTGGRPPRTEPGTTWGASDGAGVRTYGTLVLDRVTVTGNSAGQNDDGAAIYASEGSVTIRFSELAENSFDLGRGNAIVSLRFSPLHLDRSTIDAPGSTAVSGGSVVLTDSTIVADTAVVANGAGFIARSTLVATPSPASSPLVRHSGGEPLRIGGSVLDRPSGVPTDWLCSSTSDTIVSDGHNVAADRSCRFDAPGDRQGELALTRPLADNGGPTRTILLASNSPASGLIPAGTPVLCDGSLDQREVARPTTERCTAGAVTDVGAPIEALALVVDTDVDGADVSPGDGTCATDAGGCTLRAAVMEANASNAWTAALADTVAIADGVDPVLSIAGAGEAGAATGDLDVTGRLIVDGNGSTIDGAGLDRVFDSGEQPLTLRDVTVTGGHASGAVADANGGAIRSTGGHIVLDRATVRGNRADGHGGAIFAEAATVTESDLDGNVAARTGGAISTTTATVQRSLLRNNEAGWSGGAIGNDSIGYATVTDSTISGNQAPNGAAIAMTGELSYGVTLLRSTVAGNVGSASLAVSSRYCGRVCYEWSAVRALGSIIVAPDGERACDGAVVDATANLAPDGTCGPTLPGQALLGSLVDVGGPTLAHVPGTGSGAIDAVTTGTAELCTGDLVDQRRAARPQGAACDVGAIEQ